MVIREWSSYPAVVQSLVSKVFSPLRFCCRHPHHCRDGRPAGLFPSSLSPVHSHLPSMISLTYKFDCVTCLHGILPVGLLQALSPVCALAHLPIFPPHCIQAIKEPQAVFIPRSVVFLPLLCFARATPLLGTLFPGLLLLLFRLANLPSSFKSKL